MQAFALEHKLADLSKLPTLMLRRPGVAFRERAYELFKVVMGYSSCSRRLCTSSCLSRALHSAQMPATPLKLLPQGSMYPIIGY